LLVAGTVTAKVSVETDPAFEFSAYATYAWREGTPAKRGSSEERIHDSVDRELAAAGLRLADDADLWVVTHVLVDEHALEDLRDRDYWEFHSGVRAVDAYDLGRGTLVIDLIDVKLERIVWRGAITEKIDKNMKAGSKKIDKFVRRVLERLPR